VIFTTDGEVGGWYGIRVVRHEATVSIRNCKVERAINGIEILSTRVDEFPMLEGVEVQNVTGTGIYINVGELSFDAQAILNRCIVRNAGGTGIHVKIGPFALGAKLLVQDCTVERNGGTGVYFNLGTLSSDARALMKGCTVKDNNGSGIHVDDTRSLQIEGCEISFNRGSGIFIDGGSNVSMINCTFNRNVGHGVHARNLSTVTLRSCIVQNNGGHGIYGNRYVQSSWWNPTEYAASLISLDNCTVQGNAGGGVGFDTASVNITNSSIISNMGGWGVVGQSVTIKNSVVRGNKEGIYHAGGDVTVTDCMIEDNSEGWGLYIAGGNTSQEGVKRNKISGNKRGIGFGGVTNPLTRIEDNDIYGNSEYKAVNDGGSTIVTENTYWGEPTTTEIKQNISNLTKIYDKNDDSSKGEIQIISYRETPSMGEGILLTLEPGLYMVSSPFQMLEPWHEIFGISENLIKIAIWDTQRNYYRSYSNMTTSERLPTPGKAIWVKLDHTVQISLRSILPEETKPFLIALKPGWNMIGVPWQVKWKNLRLRKDNSEVSLLEAAEKGWVYDVLWGWDGEKYQWVWARESIGLLEELEPLKGYWILAMEECSLVIPPKDDANRGIAHRQRFVTDNTFVFGLQASYGQVKQSVWLGCTQDGRRGLLLPQPPQPPEASSLQMFVLDKNGQPMAIDVKAGTGRRVEWDVVLKFGSRQARQEEITLTWDGVGYAPRGSSLTLIDMTTGIRQYMRTQTSYRFVTSEGEVERRFRLIMERDNERPLRIVNLQVTSLRGQGVLIQFYLTKPAVTQVEVLSLTGRQVAIVEMGQTRYEGRNTAFWRGVNFEGHPLPRGIYLLRIHAQDQEGRQVQATRTMDLK